ncbi:hypothetical protein ACQ4PT_042548 [Festuca glaucescens]
MGAFLLLAVVLAVGGRLEASPEVPSPLPSPSPRFMDRLMSMNDCGRFAGLVTATANATMTFEHSHAHDGLIFFCPDDKAVAAFQPSFDDLCADGQVAILLYHGVAPASLRGMRPANKALTVPTLATDLANGGYNLTIRHPGDALMELSSSSGGVARVTRTDTDEEGPFVVYLIDAIQLPRESVDCCDSGSDDGSLWKHAALGVLAYFLIAFGSLVVLVAVLCLGGLIYHYCCS